MVTRLKSMFFCNQTLKPMEKMRVCPWDFVQIHQTYRQSNMAMENTLYIYFTSVIFRLKPPVGLDFPATFHETPAVGFQLSAKVPGQVSGQRSVASHPRAFVLALVMPT